MFIGVLLLFVLIMFLTACRPASQPIVITVVATPTLTPVPSVTSSPLSTPTLTSTPNPTPTPAGWEIVAEGVQMRQMIGSDDGRAGIVYALRLDPARVDVRLRYDPDRPRHVAEWFETEQSLALRSEELRPIAAINAGFFDRDNTPVGLWVIDGVTHGRGHFLMQGELRVTGAGVSIRRVNERHIGDGTRTIAAVESYPFLIMPGRAVNPCLTSAASLNPFGERCILLPAPAARTAVGIDGAGYVIFLVIPSKTFTLSGMADWLRHSDLNLDAALNLDGGSSSGMWVQTITGAWGADSGRDVPGALIAVPKPLGLDDSASP